MSGQARPLLAAGTAAFIAASVGPLATRGPLALVAVETSAAARADLNPGVHGVGTVAARR